MCTCVCACVQVRACARARARMHECVLADDKLCNGTVLCYVSGGWVNLTEFNGGKKRRRRRDIVWSHSFCPRRVFQCYGTEALLLKTGAWHACVRVHMRACVCACVREKKTLGRLLCA